MSFTLYVIHTTHTDIGYTDTQEAVKAHHIAYIREALDLIEREPRFRWNCEAYWAVHQFLKVAHDDERERFATAVRNGQIGLSGSHFNITDLIPGHVLNRVMGDDRAERESLGLTARSALTADVNGYSWGLADVFHRQGIQNLMSNIHTHHGYYPVGFKQSAFWWESPEGEKVLAWNGDHYMVGNELGIAGTPSYEYLVHDGMWNSNGDPHALAVQRIHAYVRSLKDDGYELSFSPVSVCAYMTDNASPSLRVLEFCDRFNSEGHDIELKMVTLDDFFDALRASGAEFPTYRGDWTDWWADGMGSTPAEVMQYRTAARSLHLTRKLDPDEQVAGRADYASAYENLMFYGEHTWGYCSSITEPFHPQVNNLDQWKRLYALKASESAAIVRGAVQRHHGEGAPTAHREFGFRAVNPHDHVIEDTVVFEIEHFYGHTLFDVVDEATGEKVPFQLGSHSRGPQVCVWARFEPRQTRTFRVRERPAPQLRSAGRVSTTGAEGVADLSWHVEERRAAGGVATIEEIDTPFLSIRYQVDRGITSIVDKTNSRELVDVTRPYAAFTPIYEVTPRRQGEDYAQVRRRLGRSRKAVRTRRSVGELIDIQVHEDGDLYSRVELTYRIDGAEDCAVILTAHKRSPKLEVDLRLHKNSVWEPENLYLSLPFVADEIWIDKADARLRPRVDQLPGTCIDFYAVQNAVLFQSSAPVVVTVPDTPLISLGPLEARPVRLMGEGEPNVDEVYSWVMNNYWETNFKASLGGFHQFHYELAVLPGPSVEEAFAAAERMNEGLMRFCIYEGDMVMPAR